MAEQHAHARQGLASDPRDGSGGGNHTARVGDAPGARRVLVIDDSHAFLEVVAYLLRRGGYAVEAAGSGSEGLRRLREAPPDLVVTDIHMPEVSGWDVARAAAILNPAVPVILMTGDPDAAPTAPEECALVAAVLLKPFGVRALLDPVRQLLGSVAGHAPVASRNVGGPAISTAILSGVSAG